MRQRSSKRAFGAQGDDDLVGRRRLGLRGDGRHLARAGPGAREHRADDVGVDELRGAGEEEHLLVRELQGEPAVERELVAGLVEDAPRGERHVRERGLDLFEGVDAAEEVETGEGSRPSRAKAAAAAVASLRHAPSFARRSDEVLGCTRMAPPPALPATRRALPIARAPEPAVERPDPRTVRISLTDRCDSACVYCRPSRSDGYFERAAGRRRVAGDGARAGAGGRAARAHHRRRAAAAPAGRSRWCASSPPARRRRPRADDERHAPREARRAAPRRRASSASRSRSTRSSPERFWRITRGGQSRPGARGHRGGRAAVRFDELKINTVVLRGENDDELRGLDLVGLGARHRPPLHRGDARRRGREPPARFARRRRRDARASRPPARRGRRRRASPTAARRGTSSPAKNPRLKVGFITGTTDTYCQSCDRLRVGSDGTVRPCLATNDGVAAMRPGRRRATSEASPKRSPKPGAIKPDGRVWKGCTEETAADVSMRAIGG